MDFGKIGVGICYDMDYTYVSRNLTARGAEILLFPTLDMSEWGRTQHLQHASMSAFRAVENRRYLFRVAASGVSQMVNAYGAVEHSLDFGKEGYLFAGARLLNCRTIYNRFGYLFAWICFAITILSMPVLMYYRITNKPQMR